VANTSAIDMQLARVPHSVAISASTGEGIPELIEELQVQLGAWRLRGTYRIPLADTATVAEIHRCGHVVDIQYEEDYAVVQAHVPPHIQQKLAAFAVE